MARVTNERAVLELAKAYREYDRAVPEVGMGPMDSWFVTQAAHRLGLETDDFDFDHVLRLIKG